MGRKIFDLNGSDWVFGRVDQSPWPQSGDLGRVENWYPATVPGDVRLDLLRLGKIADPLYGTNNESSRWVDGFDWWYRRDFALELAPEERAHLIFEGIDYQSSVYVNDHHLADHQGMFSRLELEVTPFLEAEPSGRSSMDLAVRLWGADALPGLRLSAAGKFLNWVLGSLFGGQGVFPRRIATLKCQMGFGWDFAPRLLTTGLWDDVSLVVTRSVYIRDVWVKTRLEGDEAQVSFDVSVDSDRDQRVELAWRVIGENCDPGREWVAREDCDLARGDNSLHLALTMARPALWEPWDRGRPNLYRFELEVRGRAPAASLDSYFVTFGLRDLAMVPNPEAPPKVPDSIFAINGQKEFIRGANWVPADAIPARVGAADYASLIGLARAANVNLLRVWGGGLREKQAFYDLCDRQGILVWQEFPFACPVFGRYPEDEGFLATVRQEVSQIVRQLRNHPSLVTWCGGNELIYAANRKLVDFLRELVVEHDGSRPFRATSPTDGESHNWRVWHRKADFAEYRRDNSQFCSEFGLQSTPVVESLQRFLPASEVYPPGKAWQHHAADTDKLNRYARAFCPSNLEEHVAATQVAQAYGFQVAIEHFRRRKYRTSGAIFWQLNEPWGCISWSVVDYYRQPKLAYEWIKRLYSPVLVSLVYPWKRYRAGELFQAQVWAINDYLEPFEHCLVSLSLGEAQIYSQVVSLAPDSSRQVGELSYNLPTRPTSWTVEASLSKDGKTLSRNSYDLGYHDVHRVGPWTRAAWWIWESLMR